MQRGSDPLNSLGLFKVRQNIAQEGGEICVSKDGPGYGYSIIGWSQMQ